MKREIGCPLGCGFYVNELDGTDARNQMHAHLTVEHSLTPAQAVTKTYGIGL